MSAVEIIYLGSDEQVPDFTDDELWLVIEPSDDGRFFGTGSARNSGGEAVFYASLPENDASLESALTAATEWAAKYGVARIWVSQTAL